MRSIRLCLSVLLLFAPLSALAQTEPVGMAPDVVITADRFPTDPAKVTGSVTVITNDDMQKRQLRTVADVLRSVPGVSVQQSGGPGTQTAVFVRGSNANHVLVLIDGVNVSDPSSSNGAVDFAHFLTENLDRVEVVRGPMSTMYGSQAIGGVINMVTKAGKGPINGAAFTELGTRLQSNSGAYVRGSEGRFNYNLTFAGTFSPNDSPVPARFWPPGGYVDVDPYRNITLASRLGVELTDTTNLTWFTRYIDTQVRYDQVGLEDPNATGFTQQLFNRVELDGSYLSGRWRPTVGISYSSIYRHDQDFPSFQNPFPFAQDAYYNGRRLQADWKNLVSLSEQIDVIAGIDFDRTWAYNNVDGSQGWGTMAQTGFYGQLRGTFFDTLNLNLAGRVDVNDTYGTVSTWRAGASYLFQPTDTKIKGSYGTAFKAPSLFELYGTGFFCAGNLSLQPEYSRGYEFGVEQGVFDRKLTAGITYFFNTFSNLIQCPPPFTSLANVANAQSEGFETFVQIRPFRWLDFNFEYTFTIARNVDANQPLVRRPQDSFNIRGEVRPWDDVRLGFGVSQVSNRYDFDAVTGAIIQPSAYTLVRFTAAYDIRSNVQLYARAENVLNQIYEEPEGFQAPYFQAFFGVKAKF
ncbi:TonB-dependent receptor plug domain-containing protein [Reyranella sp.]|uniref:TonB-dependent receptor plug domain-containing protein n=1 Tax=Reyranella sp. TaxID=1929291 RepID=UPI003783971C